MSRTVRRQADQAVQMPTMGCVGKASCGGAAGFGDAC